MNIDEIRKISLVEFLNQLGYQPTGRDSKGLWFYAPYRSERKPSFHVNPRKNLWFDFGTGAGGDIFSLAGEMSGETDFLRQADYIAEKMRLPVAIPYKPTPFVEEPTFENVEMSRLESPGLFRYLADRGIPKDIARRYCVQVDYELHGKRYYAIGFEYNAHGFELRNSFFKGSYTPKHITHTVNGNARCNVFEDFIGIFGFWVVLFAIVISLTSCSDDLDVQQSYLFTVEVMPYGDKITNGETVELRFEINPEGNYANTLYTIRYFQYDGEGTLKLVDGPVLVNNDRVLLESKTFRLNYTAQSPDAHKFLVVI